LIANLLIAKRSRKCGNQIIKTWEGDIKAKDIKSVLWLLVFSILVITGQASRAEQTNLEFHLSQEDSRSPGEIMRDFAKTTEPLRVCKADADCVLARAGCEDSGVHRKNVKKFTALAKKLQIMCGQNLNCKRAVCEQSRCTAKDCRRSNY
jgi:hypothetical protein